MASARFYLKGRFYYGRFQDRFRSDVRRVWIELCKGFNPGEKAGFYKFVVPKQQ